MDLPTASLLGLILSLSGAGFYGYATFRNYKDQQERSKKTIDFQDQLLAKQEEISRLNKEISDTAKQSYALITGGDSYVYMLPAHDSQVLHFNLYSEGTNPLYDMQVIFDDTQAVIEWGTKLEKMVKEKGQDYANLHFKDPLQAQMRRQTAVGNLIPHAVMYNVGGMTWNMANMDHRSFRIFTASRNGSTFENASVRKLADGTWVKAMRVQRVVEPEPITLKEMIDPTFPRDAKGEPEW